MEGQHGVGGWVWWDSSAPRHLCGGRGWGGGRSPQVSAAPVTGDRATRPRSPRQPYKRRRREVTSAALPPSARQLSVWVHAPPSTWAHPGHLPGVLPVGLGEEAHAPCPSLPTSSPVGRCSRVSHPLCSQLTAGPHPEPFPSSHEHLDVLPLLSPHLYPPPPPLYSTQQPHCPQRVPEGVFRPNTNFPEAPRPQLFLPLVVHHKPLNMNGSPYCPSGASPPAPAGTLPPRWNNWPSGPARTPSGRPLPRPLVRQTSWLPPHGNLGGAPPTVSAATKGFLWRLPLPPPPPPLLPSSKSPSLLAKPAGSSSLVATASTVLTDDEDGGEGVGGREMRPRGPSGRFLSRTALLCNYGPSNPRTCGACGTMATTQWRSGLKDLDSLCNGK